MQTHDNDDEWCPPTCQKKQPDKSHPNDSLPQMPDSQAVICNVNKGLDNDISNYHLLIPYQQLTVEAAVYRRVYGAKSTKS